MKNYLSLVQTEDGSTTIFNALVGENYHSMHGAVQESQHVFIQAGLNYFMSQHPEKCISILEVGFGTGLNYLLSADYCLEKGIELYYTGIEAYPLPDELIFSTAYNEYVSEAVWESFKSAYQKALLAPMQINTDDTLEVVPIMLSEFSTEKVYDIIYFDAFATANQPEMWSLEALTHVTRFIKPGGVLVTYAITGNLKRIMKSLNFFIEKVPGAPGKREMLRATKLL
ncbi:tRNA (5-methylaminomethyl-2-thiouridine)(34)-methyltransferase MnmD [Arcticibacter eurypsychrophilus]|uniref:tRNA (5-methylaminomethyl-2-thiouridine)(34)-methyltransferase MnmD n=1 Tax=Arcticibacter eurypsychrophilus TaxID=1434752 RepID=UPI00084DAE26|nr:tRNA (5-methylaminomethyl-2-thiouridine)(34)-methyltransferase MnmD [Arcticibacter eurypsychrophilus]